MKISHHEPYNYKTNQVSWWYIYKSILLSGIQMFKKQNYIRTRKGKQNKQVNGQYYSTSCVVLRLFWSRLELEKFEPETEKQQQREQQLTPLKLTLQGGRWARQACSTRILQNSFFFFNVIYVMSAYSEGLSGNDSSLINVLAALNIHCDAAANTVSVSVLSCRLRETRRPGGLVLLTSPFYSIKHSHRDQALLPFPFLLRLPYKAICLCGCSAVLCFALFGVFFVCFFWMDTAYIFHITKTCWHVNTVGLATVF